MANETKTYTALAMDRAEPLGNSEDNASRRALHTKVLNKATEPVPVYTVEPLDNGTEINQFSQILNITSGSPTLIDSFTIPAGKYFQLKWIAVAGTNIAEYTVKKNGSDLDKAYTYFSGGLNFQFEFPNGGVRFNSGDTLTIYVEHNRPSSGKFNSRIQGIEFANP